MLDIWKRSREWIAKYRRGFPEPEFMPPPVCRLLARILFELHPRFSINRVAVETVAYRRIVG